MKLTKKDIYINLRGKSKEELTDLYNFLKSVGERQFRTALNDFLVNCSTWIAYELNMVSNNWVLSSNEQSLSKKTEVTIQQLKEILQTMETETLQEKEQRLLKELEEVRKEIEESKIKVGDWAVVKSLGMVYKRLSDVSAHKNEVKLTNPELIKLLEQEMN